MYGQRIRNLRMKMGLTAKEFGKKFNLAESTISGYENETRKVDIETLQKMADFFHTNTDYILGRTNDPSQITEGTKNVIEPAEDEETEQNRKLLMDIVKKIPEEDLEDFKLIAKRFIKEK